MDEDFRSSLYDYCANATDVDGDTFVGIKIELSQDGHSTPAFHFPAGYRFSSEEEILRDEIINLVTVIQEYKAQSANFIKFSQEHLKKITNFPIQAYFTVLFDYLHNGYYKIKEGQYKLGMSGSINWARTIKLVKSIAQPNGIAYTSFRVKRHSETDRDLITEISKYCVYQSYIKIGWIYNLPLPEKPKCVKELAVYRNYLESMILRTTKDIDRQLFAAMSDILNFEDFVGNRAEVSFGTNSFEYVWEWLIQKTYGNVAKGAYLPRTEWLLADNHSQKINRALRLDTVMVENNDVYILDAKYYKFGITGDRNDLPQTSSIVKQIAYGDYVQYDRRFESDRSNGMKVYNAFLMPYGSSSQSQTELPVVYHSIGEAISSWQSSDIEYQRVQGILIDVKSLMQNKVRPSSHEIHKLSRAIKDSLKKNEESRRKNEESLYIEK